MDVKHWVSGAADESNTLITLGRRYIYDGWSVVEERTFDNGATLGNSPNTLERVYVNGRSIDEPLLAAIDGDGDEFLNTSKNTTNGVNIVDAEYYYLSNRLGSISAILDADNQDRILEYYRYEVFGSATVLPIVDNNTDGLEDTPFDLNDNNASGATLVSSFGNTYLYTARRFDDITGLYYYRNRYYDPRSGRFITCDPTETPWSNLYGYAMNRASSLMDPFGLDPWGPRISATGPNKAEKEAEAEEALRVAAYREKKREEEQKRKKEEAKKLQEEYEKKKKEWKEEKEKREGEVWKPSDEDKERADNRGVAEATFSWGNYCGPGAKGGEPTDDIDKCCKAHDRCFWLAQVSADSYGTGDLPDYQAKAACKCNQDFYDCLNKAEYRMTCKRGAQGLTFGESFFMSSAKSYFRMKDDQFGYCDE